MATRIIITDLASHSTAIRSVRTDVFIHEQEIDPDLEFDAHDLTCIHAVAFEGENPVATGRLDIEQDGRIGRVAVLKSHRRRGLGTEVMRVLEEQALVAELTRTWFHAQVQAIPFYESLGYQVIGEEFEEAGIPHVTMEKKI